MSSMLLLLFFPYVDDPISLDTFKTEYLTHYKAARKAHENIWILESVRFFHEPVSKTKWNRGGICGDYLNLSGGSNGEEYVPTERLLLTPRSVLHIRMNPENEKWYLQSYRSIPDRATFESERNSLWGQFPQAFRWYFRAPMGWGVSVEEVLEGRSKQPSLSLTTLRVDRIEAVTSGKHRAYRLSYTMLTPAQDGTKDREGHGYFDVVPDLGWVVTSGLLVHYWDSEYGDPINGVPVLKRGVHSRGQLDEKTGQITKIPMYEIVVHKAEAYTKVNEEEFQPQYYGLPATLPTQNDLRASAPNGVPPIFYVALFGIICFIAGIVILARAQRRSRLAVKAHPDTTPSP